MAVGQEIQRGHVAARQKVQLGHVAAGQKVFAQHVATGQERCNVEAGQEVSPMICCFFEYLAVNYFAFIVPFCGKFWGLRRSDGDQVRNLRSNMWRLDKRSGGGSNMWRLDKKAANNMWRLD